MELVPLSQIVELDIWFSDVPTVLSDTRERHSSATAAPSHAAKEHQQGKMRRKEQGSCEEASSAPTGSHHAERTPVRTRAQV